MHPTMTARPLAATMSAVAAATEGVGTRARSARERLRNPVVQFTLAGVTAVILVGLVAAYFLGRAGTDQAIRNAKQITALAGEGIVEPVVGEGLQAGRPEALRRVDSVVRDRILGHDGVVRVKI